jgi:hypothetical protein
VAYKEFMIILLGFIITPKLKIKKRYILIYVFILIIGFRLVTDTIPFSIRIIGVRTYLLLFAGLFLGEYLGRTSKLDWGESKVFLYICITYSVGCLLQHFVFPLSIFREVFPILEMKREILDQNTLNEYYNTGLPVNFMGERTVRLLGPFNEPLYAAYYALFFFNIYFFRFYRKQDKKSAALSILLIVLIFLTQTRAVILSALLLVAFLYRSRINLKTLLVFIVSGIGVVVLFKDWILELFGSMFSFSGRSIGHVLAYIEGIGLIINNPFGYGLGFASSLSGYMDGANKVNPLENAILNMALELGIIPALILCIYLIKLLLFNNRYEGSDHLPYSFLIVQMLFMGLLAPHIFTSRILIPYAIFIGFGTGRVLLFKQKNEN